MVIGIFGESCTGKSTLAEKIAASFPCEIVTGKDWLRLAKNENIAKALFRKKLEAAVNGEHIIYVISEKEHLELLPEGSGYDVRLDIFEPEECAREISRALHGK